MTRSLRRTVVTVALALGSVLGCASERLVQVRESATSDPLAFKRVAIAPFRAAARPGAGALPADAGALIASYVSEALAARGIDVVPPSDVEQGLSGGAEDRSITQLVGERFGADAAAIGTVWRWRERSGAAMGSINPAGVGFEVKIFSAQTGKLLWAAVFDHTQVALGENALVAAQYPGGGTRWMTAEELARFGADRIVREMPLAQ